MFFIFLNGLGYNEREAHFEPTVSTIEEKSLASIDLQLGGLVAPKEISLLLLPLLFVFFLSERFKRSVEHLNTAVYTSRLTSLRELK